MTTAPTIDHAPSDRTAGYHAPSSAHRLLRPTVYGRAPPTCDDCWASNAMGDASSGSQSTPSLIAARRKGEQDAAVALNDEKLGAIALLMQVDY
jgi:hypothetical protein